VLLPNPCQPKAFLTVREAAMLHEFGHDAHGDFAGSPDADCQADVAVRPGPYGLLRPGAPSRVSEILCGPARFALSCGSKRPDSALAASLMWDAQGDGGNQICGVPVP
jgi:hypothetical protein